MRKNHTKERIERCKEGKDMLGIFYKGKCYCRYGRYCDYGDDSAGILISSDGICRYLCKKYSQGDGEI